jgi:hypothetical protein
MDDDDCDDLMRQQYRQKKEGIAARTHTILRYIGIFIICLDGKRGVHHSENNQLIATQIGVATTPKTMKDDDDDEDEDRENDNTIDDTDG